MADHPFSWLKWVSEIQSIAQAGLTYSQSPFDQERYERLSELGAELAAVCSDKPLSDVAPIFSLEKGYATPKLDVRTFILKEDKILLVKERSDGCWTLPGGWIDVNESPSMAAIRETKEETGYTVAIIKLLALWDKLKHDHPPQWPHAYKCFFQAEITSGVPTENLEISDIDFFDRHQLPPLSTHRVTAKQIARLYELVVTSEPTQFD